MPEGSRLLYISGEVGGLPDGTVPKGIEAQAEACWRNIIAILADARMGIGDLVKITTYLVRSEDVVAAGAARAKHFGDARPGSATIIVKALVNAAVADRDRGGCGGCRSPTLIYFATPGGMSVEIIIDDFLGRRIMWTIAAEARRLRPKTMY